MHIDVYTVNTRLTCGVRAPRRTRNPPPINGMKPRRRAIAAGNVDARAKRCVSNVTTNLERHCDVAIFNKKKREVSLVLVLITRPRRSLARRTQQEKETKIDPRGFQSEDRTHFMLFGVILEARSMFDVISEPGSTVKNYFML